MTKRCIIAIVSIAIFAGCTDPKEKFGRTWYLDGAGNWGFGVLDVPAGLHDRGYEGVVSNYHWSLTMNPALDQTLRFIARGSGSVLAGEITDYLKRNPNGDANVIALSAGTGVAMWAAEDMKPPYKINNMILLGASISSNFDARKALSNMKGNVYVYYAGSDPVLNGPVRLLGTIDGKFDDSAGLVGLRGPGRSSGRIINVGWRSSYERLGWTGGHADCTNRKFVAEVISPHIIGRRDRAPAKVAVGDGAAASEVRN